MNDLMLLTFLMMSAHRKPQQEENNEQVTANQEPVCENTKETENETEDNYDLFPVTYLPDMYLVQEDDAAENDNVADGFRRRNIAKSFIDANGPSFDEAEQSIIRLFLAPNVNKESLLITLKDYCDHLYELAKDGTLDKIFDESRKK